MDPLSVVIMNNQKAALVRSQDNSTVGERSTASSAGLTSMFGFTRMIFGRCWGKLPSLGGMAQERLTTHKKRRFYSYNCLEVEEEPEVGWGIG